MEVRPFVGLRYDSRAVGPLDRVFSPPYDQFDDELQKAAYRQSPYHFVRLILNRDPAPHEAAAATLADWRARGVLCPETAPAIYPYAQVFRDVDGRERVRRGFYALLRLTELSAGPLYAHERTLPAPVADRLLLTRSTRADFGPLFVVFPDPGDVLSAALGERMTGRPQVDAIDLDGNRHHLWVDTDASWQADLVHRLGALEGIIADGHNRYEAALHYAREMRAAGAPPDDPSQYKLAVFFPGSPENLRVFPVHRVVEDWPEDADPTPYFSVSPVAYLRPEDLVRQVSRTPGAFGVFSRRGGAELWTLRDDAPLVWSDELSDAYRHLPSAAFEASVLRGMLRMSPERIAAKKGLRFVKQVGDVKRLIWQNHDRAFLLPPTPLEAVFAAARAGELLPQKSTHFYPKPLSGLVTYVHDPVQTPDDTRSGVTAGPAPPGA